MSIPLTMARTPLTAWRPIAAAILITLALPMGAASAYPKPKVAALQVALKALHHYGGAIDGIRGPKTIAATKRFQRKRRLAADGVVGPKTRRALGKRGRPKLGSRVMRKGQRGWDVAALQFMLRKRGFSPGSVDGGFGPRTLASVRRFQAARNLTVDGLVGRATLSALRKPRSRRSSSGGGSGTPSGPVRFLRPVGGPMGDGFGYPHGRRHDGIDFPVGYGTPVGAAGVGTVSFAGWNTGGYGNLVVIQHRLGFQTWYAHMASVAVRGGQRVAGGVRVGAVGSTGRSSGPHLHWEVRRNGTPVNPMPYLLSSTSLGKLLFAPHDTHHDCPAVPVQPRPQQRKAPATAVMADC